MTVIPDKFSFTLWRGTTFRETMTLYASDGVTPRDLTGYTASMSIEDPSNGCALLFLLSTGNSRIVLGGIAGTIELFISAADTDFVWDQGVYELTITGPGPTDDTDALLFGAFHIRNSC